MKTLIKQIAVLSVLLTVGAISLPAASIAAEPSYDPLEARVSMVRKLLFESSAAKQVLGSGDSTALAKRKEAVDAFERAAAGGDLETRKLQLNQAVATMYEAVGLVTQSAGGEEKERRDFANRKDSFEALLAAHERIMKEKGTPQHHVLLLAEIEEDTKAADAMLAAGDLHEARAHLDKAYEKTMLSVEHSRTGETLTRELKFDSPKDEYEYELDRNDTHRMLLTVLLEEKLKDEKIKQRVSGFIDAADGHRLIATDYAASGHYEEAIDALELSTNELVKAIRGAGVYIPG